MTRPVRRLLGVALFTAVLGLSAPAASADPSPQTDRLCSGSSVTCSIQVAPVIADGSTTPVVVTGTPGATVEVQLRQFGAGQPVTAMTPLGPPVTVTTDATGFGATTLSLPALPAGVAGGPVLFTLADATGSRLSEVLGTWSLLTTGTPLLLGDGYDRQKPVGAPLELQLAAVPAGSRFSVDYTDDIGQAHSASDPAAQACPDPAACTIGYTVPRGLAATDREFRLIDGGTGAAVATWTVLPSADGALRPPDVLGEPPAVGADVPGSITASVGATSNPVPQPRSANLDRPEVGSAVLGARDGDSAGPVLWIGGAAFGLAGFALALAGVWHGTRYRLPPRLAREAIDD